MDSREQVAIKLESHFSHQPKTLLEEARLLMALHRACEGGIAVCITFIFLIRNCLYQCHLGVCKYSSL